MLERHLSAAPEATHQSTMQRRPLIDRLLPLLGLLCCAMPLAAQQPPVRETPRPMEFLGSQDDNLFSLTRSQEDIHQWELALDELARGEAAAAVERLHKLLRTEIGGVTPVAPGRFLGLRLAVVTTLANLPPAAVDAYEALVRREAGNLALRQPTELEEDQLLALATRFPASQIGRAARLRLGDLRLEAGAGSAAADHFRQALDETPIGSAEEARLIERLHCASVLQTPRTARAALAGKTLPAAGATVLEVLPTMVDPTLYAGPGGGEDGRTPMAEPAGKPALVRADQIDAPGFDAGYPAPAAFAMLPVGDLDGIYVNTGRRLIAYDPLRGMRSWESDSPVQDDDRRSYRSRRNDRDDGQINQHAVLAAACGTDVVVAALQVPDNSVNVDFNQGLQIIRKLPVRRLFAFARSSGKQLWAHFDEIDGPRTRRFAGHDACGPPLVVGDTVYAPIHDRSGAIAFSIAAYDLRTGAPKWRRLVCSSQQEVNMFGNARAEFAASPLAHQDGVLYGAANLGIVYALELATGRIRWIAAHEVVRMPMTRFHGQSDRPVYFANNAPAIVGGTVCFTPLDSAFALGVDAETGRILWRLSADAPVDGTENNVRWLAGVLDDEFVLAGRGAIAVKARPDALLGGAADVRQLVRPELLAGRGAIGSLGRPATTADHVWFATSGQILGFDRAGNPLPQARQIQAQRFLPGNLLFVDGIVVSLRQGALEVLADFAAVQARIEARLRHAPDDPAAILRLAALRRALLPETASAEAIEAVTALYRRGVQACIDRGLPRQHPVRQALQQELYDQAMDAASRAIDRGDPRAFGRLAEARQVAPDQRAWLRVQLLVIEQAAGDPARLRGELDLLEREASAATLTLADGLSMPVAAFLLWRRAQLPGDPPDAMVNRWQELLENHPEVTIAGERAAVLAEAAIGDLIARHGKDAYAAVAARADAALAAAGDDRTALRAVGTRFPNSAAAAAARTALLDLSVKAGDLAMACEVLAQALRTGAVPPGILRRGIVAAQARGNRGLAAALTDRLDAHRTTRSDWPDDGGRSYGDVIADLRRSAPATPLPPLQVPAHLRAQIQPRTPREVLQLRPVLHGEGFQAPADEPLFAIAGAELVAIDLHAKTDRKPFLWALPVQFLEHVVLCGTTLVVPDLDRLFAVDYRSGEVRWELPGARGRLLDGLGVQAGVLHVSAQYDDPQSGAEFLGIEPLTGSVLFARTLPGDRLRPVPKPIDGHLLVMQAAADGSAEVLRLDPLTGATVATIQIEARVLRSAAELRPDGLAQRVFPQGLCGDRQRIYLPIDSTFSGDAPRLLAIDDAGKVVWSWQGRSQSRLLMTALRGGQLVVVEGSEDAAGRVCLLDAHDGATRRSTPLGIDIDVLNWQRTWLPNPAPPAVLLADYAEVGRERRLVCFAVDEAMPSFLLPLSTEDGEIERHPQFGADFVAFGVRPAQRGGFRLHALKLADRSGALPDGQKYIRPTRQATFGMAAVGPYTVVSCTDCLMVFGARGDK